MNERLKNYIEELFKDAPKSTRTEEYKEEIYNNNVEKMNDLILEGMSEQDAFSTVCAGMGDMSELFELLKEETSAPEFKSEPKRKKRLPAVAIVFIVIGALFVTAVLAMLLLSVAETTATLIGNRIETNIMEPLPLDIETEVTNNSAPIGTAIVIEQEINTVDISLKAGEVIIGKSDSGKLVLKEKCGSDFAEPMTYSISSGTLSVDSMQNNNLFGINDPVKKTLYVYLPNSKTKIKLDTATADISIEKGLALGDLKFFTTTGSITASDITADGIFISSASGSTNLSKVFVDRDIDIETTSGDITVLDADCANMLYINTTSGDVRAENVNAEGIVIDSSSDFARLSGINAASLKIDAVSGDISLHTANVSDTDIDAVSGSVEINGLEGEKLDIETGSGSVGVDNADVSDMKIETASGAVFLAGDVPEGAMITTTGGEVVFTAGENDFGIHFKTTSGNIVTDLPYTASNDGITVFGDAAHEKPINVETTSGDILVQ